MISSTGRFIDNLSGLLFQEAFNFYVADFHAFGALKLLKRSGCLVGQASSCKRNQYTRVKTGSFFQEWQETKTQADLSKLISSGEEYLQ